MFYCLVNCIIHNNYHINYETVGETATNATMSSEYYYLVMWTGIKSLGFPANLTLVIFCVWVSGASWDLWAGREHGPCCRKNRPGPFCSASARATKTELSPSAGLTNPVVVCFCECVRVWTKFKTCSNQGFNNMDSKAKTDSVCLVRISGHCCLQWSSLSWIKWFQHQTFRYLSSCVCLIFYSVCGPPP